MSEYHVKIDDKGYMLATRSGGGLAATARTQRADPFTKYVQSEDLFRVQEFGFDEGAGQSMYAGAKGQYRRGTSIDTRGGNLILGPKLTMCQSEPGSSHRPGTGDTMGGIAISTGGNHRGYGVQFTVPTGKSALKNVSVLLKRDSSTWWTASDFSVEICSEVGGLPGTALSSKAVDPNRPPETWEFVCDPWPVGEYFWLTVEVGTTSVAAGSNYWLVVRNNSNSKVLYWAFGGNKGSVAWWNGVSWSGTSEGDKPYFRVNYSDQIDAPPLALEEFRGEDGHRRMYAALGAKVMYYDPGANTWYNSYTGFTYPVTDLIWFNERLFAAQGQSASIAHHTGANATGTWTVLPDLHPAQCFAIHDNLLWKASGAEVKASPEGLNSAWGANGVTIGDPGTIVTAMISHGGKLFALKEEGLFELSYPDTYPDTDTPTCNMALDFRTDRAARGWALDWHSGLYFPGSVGLYSWQGGILRDLWSSLEEDGMELARPADTLMDIEQGAWLAAVGTTRGLFAALMSPYTKQTSVWYYAHQKWHPIYQATLTLAEYIRGMHFESIGAGRGRLWIGKGHNIGYFYIPTWTDDRSLDDTADFQTSGEVELPAFDDGNAQMLKCWAKVGIKALNLAAGSRTVTVSYRIDGSKGDTTWTTLGTMTTSPYLELAFPSGTTGRSIRLRLQLAGTSSETPEVEAVSLFYQPLPETVVTYQLTIELGDYLERLNGTEDDRTAGELWAELAALDGQAAPIDYVDEYGATHKVRVMGVTRMSSALQVKPPAGKGGSGVQGQAIISMIENDIQGQAQE